MPGEQLCACVRAMDGDGDGVSPQPTQRRACEGSTLQGEPADFPSALSSLLFRGSGGRACSPGNSWVLGRPLRTWQQVPRAVELMVGWWVGWLVVFPAGGPVRWSVGGLILPSEVLHCIHEEACACPLSYVMGLEGHVHMSSQGP